MRKTLAAAVLVTATASAAVLPAAPAHAYCTNDPCALECALFVIRHFDPKDPSFVCPL